MSRLLERKSV